MKLNHWSYVIIFICWHSLAKGEEYPISNIPDSLRKEVHSVIRFDSASLDIQGLSGYTYSEVKVISILTTLPDRPSLIGVAYNDRENVQNFKAWLYDGTGNLIKRFDDAETNDISLTGTNLSGSTRIKVINLQKTRAPYTVKYSYDKTVTGTAFLLPWMPATEFDQSVESAILKIKKRPEQHINFMPYRLDKPDSSDDIFTWKIIGRYASKSEAYGPEASEVLPRLDLTLTEFELYGVKGSCRSWDDIGKFINVINQQNNDLKHLSDRELNNIFDSKQKAVYKVKALFNYLQHNFHYGAIEAGIGSWKPEDAAITMKKKYGDCKGLVTLLKALLKKAGIESYYALVNTNVRNEMIVDNFPTLSFNHVVLCVPLPEDTIWLECTSPVAPFNYLYDKVSGRPALLIFDGGGRLITTPIHNEMYNASTSVLHIKSNDDNSEINAIIKLQGCLQDTVREVITQNNQKITETVLYQAMHLKNMSIKSYKLDSVLTDSPVVILKIQVSNGNSIHKTDARIYIQTDIFTPVPYIPPKNEKRSEPINIPMGISQTDTLEYNLPPDYIPENFVSGDIKTMSLKFGTADFMVKYSTDKGELEVIRHFTFHSGAYPKEEYSAFRSFLFEATKTICPELVLRKKT